MVYKKTLVHTFSIYEKGGGKLKEIEVIIDTDEIAEFFFRELLKRGYVPAERELDDLADITFDYLLEKSIIDEEINDES
jgi:hypothetical protein